MALLDMDRVYGPWGWEFVEIGCCLGGKGGVAHVGWHGVELARLGVCECCKWGASISHHHFCRAEQSQAAKSSTYSSTPH